eukprot:scaffold217825_cov32-Prasinocladus_malaysianus.AAC.3
MSEFKNEVRLNAADRVQIPYCEYEPRSHMRSRKPYCSEEAASSYHYHCPYEVRTFRLPTYQL